MNEEQQLLTAMFSFYCNYMGALYLDAAKSLQALGEGLSPPEPTIESRMRALGLRTINGGKE